MINIGTVYTSKCKTVTTIASSFFIFCLNDQTIKFYSIEKNKLFFKYYLNLTYLTKVNHITLICKMVFIEIVAASGSLAATAAIGKSVSADYWYDLYHQYVLFDSELTLIIDRLLMDPLYGTISTYKIISGATSGNIPGYSKHYYYTKGREYWYLGLEKKQVRYGNEINDYYIGWHEPCDSGRLHLSKFKQRIFEAEKGTIKVTSVNTMDHSPKLYLNTQILHPPKPTQKASVEFIIDQYNERHNFNLNVFLYGYRGLGKSHTAFLIKTQLDLKYNCNSMIVDDFDPSQAGVNVKSLILQKANVSSPVILLINEVETIYFEATKSKQFVESRLLHTKSKKTLNDMFDAISSTKYVITIYTTEISPETLYATEEYRSFMRPGRVDWFMEIKPNEVFARQNIDGLLSPQIDVNANPETVENRDDDDNDDASTSTTTPARTEESRAAKNIDDNDVKNIIETIKTFLTTTLISINDLSWYIYIFAMLCYVSYLYFKVV